MVPQVTSLAEVGSTYRQRLADRTRSYQDAQARNRRISNLRLAVFAGGATVLIWSLTTSSVSPLLALPFAAGFLALVFYHDRVIRECERLERAVEFYEHGMERIEDRWAGRGRSGQRFRDPEHPYAEDLDLFGRGSLFERLCTARTSGGEECLARWLMAPSDMEVILGRQRAVEELRDRLDTREALDLLAVVTQKRVEPGFLLHWAEQMTEPVPAPARAAMAVLGAATVVGAALWVGGNGATWFLIAAGVGQALAAPFRARVRHAISGVEKAALELSFLLPVLDHLEREEYTSASLLAIRRRISAECNAVGALRHLETLDGYLQMRGNFLTGAVTELLLLTPQVASAVARWRSRFAATIPDWIAAVGEFEALSAMASYAYENPDDPFPEFVKDGTSLDARGIRHPLLPGPVAVANDITLGLSRRLYIVSGSNMSGKSTLLRTIGANVVLAQAGAPVRAESFRLSLFQVGASIRTMDSLHEGVSRFYAEIQRLRDIVELASSGRRVLFLLDEILHGTNSHDRRIGAEAVVRSLLDRGAVGLLTTHDLALARIAEEPGSGAVNVHFQDELRDGKMFFDYRLKPGVVEKSNALELMRAVGLEV